MHTLASFVDHGIINGSYTMMAKPMKTLELHYPMIQFLIIRSIYCRKSVHDYVPQIYSLLLTSTSRG